VIARKPLGKNYHQNNPAVGDNGGILVIIFLFFFSSGYPLKSYSSLMIVKDKKNFTFNHIISCIDIILLFQSVHSKKNMKSWDWPILLLVLFLVTLVVIYS